MGMLKYCFFDTLRSRSGQLLTILINQLQSTEYVPVVHMPGPGCLVEINGATS
jgi:hypothetical protein